MKSQSSNPDRVLFAHEQFETTCLKQKEVRFRTLATQTQWFHKKYKQIALQLKAQVLFTPLNKSTFNPLYLKRSIEVLAQIVYRYYVPKLLQTISSTNLYPRNHYSDYKNSLFIKHFNQIACIVFHWAVQCSALCSAQSPTFPLCRGMRHATCTSVYTKSVCLPSSLRCVPR